MMTALLSTVALAQTAPEGAYMSSKPAACMDTTALFKKFTDDKNEQHSRIYILQPSNEGSPYC